MQIPFTVEQFFNVFKNYNLAIWPAQIGAYLLGIAALLLAIRKNKFNGPIITGILALFWLWSGGVYHIIYFSPINPVARIFGILFIIQGLLFLSVGWFHGKLAFHFSCHPVPLFGAGFILYAMGVYPLLGSALGHFYPAAPVFGVAPCPTTIFTFGILLWATPRVPVYLIIIPLLWSFVGMSAAVHLKVPQDYGLVIAGILGTILILMQNRRKKQPVTTDDQV